MSNLEATSGATGQSYFHQLVSWPRSFSEIITSSKVFQRSENKQPISSELIPLFPTCSRKLENDNRNSENCNKTAKIIELSRRNTIFERTLIHNKSAEYVKFRGHEGDKRAIRFSPFCKLAPNAQKTLHSTMFLSTPDSRFFQKSIQVFKDFKKLNKKTICFEIIHIF